MTRVSVVFMPPVQCRLVGDFRVTQRLGLTPDPSSHLLPHDFLVRQKVQNVTNYTLVSAKDMGLTLLFH